MSPRKRKLPFKRRRKFHQYSKNRRPGDAHTILSFCASNAISESLYYALKRKNKGPREIELDGRIIITERAEADWRAEREAETTAKRQAAESHGACEKATATATA
jgi:hypothetical protein